VTSSLEQLSDDIFDVGHDRLTRCCRRVRTSRRSSRTFVGGKSKHLVLECSALESGRDSSAEEEE
jgi:hypothetical protein